MKEWMRYIRMLFKSLSLLVDTLAGRVRVELLRSPLREALAQLSS